MDVIGRTLFWRGFSARGQCVSLYWLSGRVYSPGAEGGPDELEALY